MYFHKFLILIFKKFILIINSCRKFEPSDILKSIKEVKKKIADNDIEEKIGPILDKVANYAIDPEELAKVKRLDDKISMIDMQLVKNLNKIKK